MMKFTKFILLPSIICILSQSVALGQNNRIAPPVITPQGVQQAIVVKDSTYYTITSGHSPTILNKDTYVIPADTDSLEIKARGGDGGFNLNSGALSRAFYLAPTAGDTLDVVIGMKATTGNSPNWSCFGGGGGASAVIPHDSISLSDVNAHIVVVAGGGAGLDTCSIINYNLSGTDGSVASMNGSGTAGENGRDYQGGLPNTSTQRPGHGYDIGSFQGFGGFSSSGGFGGSGFGGGGAIGSEGAGGGGGYGGGDGSYSTALAPSAGFSPGGSGFGGGGGAGTFAAGNGTTSSAGTASGGGSYVSTLASSSSITHSLGDTGQPGTVDVHHGYVCINAYRTVQVTYQSINDVTFSDPCRCDDPLNGTNGTYYFHDVLQIIAPGATEVLLDSTQSMDFYNAVGPTYHADSTAFTMTATDTFQLDFWSQSGGPVPTVWVIIDGTPTPVPAAVFSICNQSACPAPAQNIPTLGEWGLIILILLMMTISVVYIRHDLPMKVEQE